MGVRGGGVIVIESEEMPEGPPVVMSESPAKGWTVGELSLPHASSDRQPLGSSFSLEEQEILFNHESTNQPV